MRRATRPLADDRGAPVRTRARSDMGATPEDLRESERWALGRARRGALRASLPYAGIVGMVAAVGIPLALAGNEAVSAGELPVWAAITSGWIALLVIIGRLLGREYLRHFDYHLHVQRLQGGRCAACGFGLVGVRPQPDGLLECPECRAAWHPARFPPPLPPARRD